jgi:hypothetical protein
VSERTITVCDKCLRACCWQGEFMCDAAQCAGTTERTQAQLRELNREHSDYWEGKRCGD